MFSKNMETTLSVRIEAKYLSANYISSWFDKGMVAVL
jgi:hypothetical protein